MLNTELGRKLQRQIFHIYIYFFFFIRPLYNNYSLKKSSEEKDGFILIFFTFLEEEKVTIAKICSSQELVQAFH